MRKPLTNLTPLFESVPLSQASGKKVLLKMECFQAAGSFKIRGIERVCASLLEQGYGSFVCPSGGNAGYAVAWAGREWRVPTTIIMPEGASESARRAVRLLGAEVIVQGRTWYESNDLAMQMAQANPRAAYVSPYENPLLWSGYSTMMDECAVQGEKPDAVVLSIGGGGLMSGVIEGLDNNGWGDVTVIGCGTYGANAFAASMQAGRLTRLERVTSLVTCISAEIITSRVMDYAHDHTLLPYLTSDYAALGACERFLDDHRVLVDPACGVALSAVYDRSSLLDSAQTVLVIVCGGVGISRAYLDDTRLKASNALNREDQ